MKKYMKPELLFENFELAQHIASMTCAAIINSADPSVCSASITLGETITGIFEDSKICDNDALMQLYCYTNQSNIVALFAS